MGGRGGVQAGIKAGGEKGSLTEGTGSEPSSGRVSVDVEMVCEGGEKQQPVRVSLTP